VLYLRFFETLGAKNTLNTDVFGVSGANNHGIYDVFFCGQHQQKRSYLRSFHHVAIISFFCKRHKIITQLHQQTAKKTPKSVQN